MTPISLEAEPSWKDEIPPGLAPDSCLTLREENEAIAARCALWWNDSPHDPEFPGQRVGAIGQFTCTNVDSGTALLGRAKKVLEEAGCRRAVGPLDGDTWHSYRFITGGRDQAAPFFLEPWNEEIPVDALEAAGFTPWARYSSSAIPLEEVDVTRRERLDRIAGRARDRGIEIRPLRPEDFEAELGKLYELSEVAFRDNFLYTPISRESFLSLYRPVESLVVPEFVLLAERAGETAGFVFALPDALPDALAPRERRLIVKTLATHPHHRHLGLGSLLVARVQETARQAGFRTAIHALQFQDNSSLKITGRHAGRRIREYTLFHCPLVSR